MRRYLCQTTCPDGLPSYAVITLDVTTVRVLLSRLNRLQEIKIEAKDLSCMEYHAHGDVYYLDDLTEDGWDEMEDLIADAEQDPNPREGLPGFAEVPKSLPVPTGVTRLTLERLVVMENELYWATDLDDVSGTAETKTISKQTLERWLQQNPKEK